MHKFIEYYPPEQPQGTKTPASAKYLIAILLVVVASFCYCEFKEWRHEHSQKGVIIPVEYDSCHKDGDIPPAFRKAYYERE